MEAVARDTGRKARSCDASLWMNLFIVALPVLIVIAVAAFLLGFLNDGARARG